MLDDPPPEGESFLLDGQGIVLEDYLAVRPERRDALIALLRSGRLEAGPWYVLADELIPSGEALVRNLLLGRRVLASLGAESQPVLYCPDAFGHPAALPELAQGFGLPLMIAWRGFGSRRSPSGDTFLWRAPSGATAVLFHLPRSGYELGSSLPDDDRAAVERWDRMRAELEPRSATGVLLVQNGADHHARQRHYRQALAALERAATATDARAQGSSMRRFTAGLLDAVGTARLPTVSGELRDSYGYTWTLQGTFGTRAHQKRRNARAERALLREAEPFAAIARARGAVSRQPLTIAAWRTLLEAHPHDTLCGCSIDDVARAMDVRVASAMAQARGIASDAVMDLIDHRRDVARERKRDWTPALVVWNRAARARGGVAIVDVDDFIADVPVGPGSGSGTAPHHVLPAANRLPAITGALARQSLGSSVATIDRVESPRHYPDNDLVARQRVAIWLEPIPAYGVAMLPRNPAADVTAERVVFAEMKQLATQPEPPVAEPAGSPRASVLQTPYAGAARAADRTGEGIFIENGLLRIQVRQESVTVEDVQSGRRIHQLLRIGDRIDRGDLYTPSTRGPGLLAQHRETRVLHDGPLVATVRLQWQLVGVGRAEGRIDVDLTLHADSPVIRIDARGLNASEDHRLRLGIATDVEQPDVWADAAFGLVHRPSFEVPPEDAVMEQPPSTAPLHRYVSLFAADRGVTLFSDGLGEYEAASDGTAFVTLVRAVGQLSRNDLPERPGHAGWPAPTPLAQSLGPFAAKLALMLHGSRSDDTIALIERTADDVLLPLRGDTLRSALAIAPATLGAELVGDGLAFSALKESEDGSAIVARCVNLLERDVEGAWQFGFSFRTAHRARLDETMLEPLSHDGQRVEFRAGAREVVTILVIPDAGTK